MMTKEKVKELYELSKLDNAEFTGSDIRQLCGLITRFADSTVWVVERNFRTPEMQSDDWRYLSDMDGYSSDDYFTSDWDKSAKFHDDESAKRILGSDFPDHWNIRIVPHTIMEDRWA